MLGMLGILGMSACFIESAEPATFRFECGPSSECDVGEVCASGLCQQACGTDEAAACPQTAPVCLNGYCSSVCPISEDVCPAPQSCMSLTLPDEDPAESGVCAVPCSEAAPCPDGMFCYADLGVCVQTCMSTDECGSGEECLMGFCVPSDAGGGSFP
jgi:hypothetical protein